MSNHLTVPASRQVFHRTFLLLTKIEETSPTAYEAITQLENAIVRVKRQEGEAETDAQAWDQSLQLNLLIAVYELMKKEG